MSFFLFLVFKIFSISFQGIPTAFFCDDLLKGVYVVNGNNLKKIDNGWDGSWEDPYVYDNLDIAPGDLVRMYCKNELTDTFGAGCFFVYNKCYCGHFYIGDVIPEKNDDEHYSRTAKLNGKDCSMTVYHLKETGYLKIYEYQHYVPLDVNDLSCVNNNGNNNPIIALNGVNKNIQLSNYIKSATYTKITVESSITSSNYAYFKLNSNTLTSNQKFNSEEQIAFNSKPHKNIILLLNFMEK